MTVIGAIVRPELPPELIRSIALAAEAAGLDELWLWEDSFSEGGIAMCGAVLGMTERMRVGIGVMPFPLRNVALTAMEIAALDRLFPGRFIPGLGHGVQSWMGQAGVRAKSFLTLEREYVTALRGLLAGEEVTVAGDYVNLDRVRLEWPPASAPALHVGAIGPKSLGVSGEMGDGTILVSDTVLADVPRILRLIAEGRERAGRSGEQEVTVFLSATTTDVDGTIASAHAWAEAGAHRVVLEPARDEADPEAFVQFVAREIQPAFP